MVQLLLLDSGRVLAGTPQHQRCQGPIKETDKKTNKSAKTRLESRYKIQDAASFILQEIIREWPVILFLCWGFILVIYIGDSNYNWPAQECRPSWK